MLTGYRTIIYAALVAISPWLSRKLGIDIDANGLTDGAMAAVGAGILILRAVTRTPIGKKD